MKFNYRERDATNRRMRPVVVRLDVVEVACIFECRAVPVQFAHPEMDVRVPVPDGAEIALEVTDIDRVKANLRKREV